MATTNGGPAQPQPQPQSQSQSPQLNVLGQYVKDFSFENPNAPRSLAPGHQPSINIQINVNANRLNDTEFEVELSFDNIPEKLVIPFNAVKGFLDPAVQFGLQFVTAPPEIAAAGPPVHKQHEPPPAKAGIPAEPPEAKVVSLDLFRKK